MKINTFKMGLMAYLTMTLTLAGCASTSQLSRDQVLQQNNDIAQLELALKAAEKKGVNYLAPEGFNSAVDNLQEAVESAQSQENDEARRLANQGSARLQQADKDASTSRYILEEVLTIRERARQAGATALYPEQSADLEDRLRKAANLVEKNKLNQAKKLRAELIKDYAQLELKALKEDTAQSASDAIERARKADAAKFAPKTFKLAQDKLKMSKTVLEADRTDRKQANAHARDSIALADQSIQITELLKDFDRRDFTEEDKVLWYQKQLSTVNEPMDNPLKFSQPNRMVVSQMRDAIDELVKERDLAQKQLQASQTQMTMTAKQRDAMEKREREMQQRFEFVQSLFKDNEANVYRQRQNVLMSVHGFYFPSGQSRIESQNFALLNKINKAIQKFPDSKLLVSGHTDSRGDEKINLSLSQGRASNVAKFLIETGGIDAKRITVRGYGEAKPVASNENAGGRSLNRRVEVLIINQ